METSQEINLLAALWPLAIIVFLIAVGVVLLNQQFQKKLMLQQLEKEELKSQHQKRLLQTSIEVQEKERKRIAQDLHDELGATLSISRMQLVQLENQKVDVSEKVAANLLEVRKAIESALSSTRRISHELMPPNLVNLGLDKALKELVDLGIKAGNIKIELSISNNLEQLPWAYKVGLYRVFAELINNTLKHSGGATKAYLHINFENSILRCKYSDNGQGLHKTSQKGLGLKGLEGRVEALGGSWEFGSLDKGGFFAEIHLSLKSED